MINYETKVELLFKIQKMRCPVCNKYVRFDNIDLHHKMRNTTGNRKNYPNLINSILNLELVHDECHIYKHGLCGNMSDIEATKYERFLNKHKKINKYLNGNIN